MKRIAAACGIVTIALATIAVVGGDSGRPNVQAWLWFWGGAKQVEAEPEDEEEDVELEQETGYCCGLWSGSNRCYKAGGEIPCRGKVYDNALVCTRECKAGLQAPAQTEEEKQLEKEEKEEEKQEAKPPSPKRIGRQASSQSSKPKQCFVCQYAGLVENGMPACDHGRDRTSCLALTTAGGPSTRDCRWSEGRCVSSFMLDCLTRMRTERADEMFMLEEEQTMGSIGEKLATCTDVNYAYRGHAATAYCERTPTNVAVCVDLDPQCQNFRSIVAGCKSFHSGEGAEQFVEQTRNKLKPSMSLIVEGNQPENEPQLCSTRLDLTVSCDRVVQEYEACHQKGDPCYGRFGNESINCSDVLGNIVQETCCYDDRWYPGGKCPPTVTKVMDNSHHAQGDKCDVSVTAESCADAGNSAQRQVESCLKRGREWCEEHDGSFETHGCATPGPAPVSYQPFSCKAEVLCPWTCSGIPADED